MNEEQTEAAFRAAAKRFGAEARIIDGKAEKINGYGVGTGTDKNGQIFITLAINEHLFGTSKQGAAEMLVKIAEMLQEIHAMEAAQ